MSTYFSVNDLNIDQRADLLYEVLKDLGGWQTTRQIRDHLWQGPLTGTSMNDSRTYRSLMRLLETGRIQSRSLNARVLHWRVTP